jgi:hypothetical protein
VHECWTTIDILLGLKYEVAFFSSLMNGVRAMKESTTYQRILEEGQAIGKMLGWRSALLRLGTKKFGPPDAKTKLAIEAIDSLDQLDDLVERCLVVSTWTELLAN